MTRKYRSSPKNKYTRKIAYGYKKLVRECDDLLSRVVVMSAADADGWVACVTCGARYQYADRKRINCGHYRSRAKWNTRYDRRNVAPQCAVCNAYGRGTDETSCRGETYKFMLYLDEKYGPQTASFLTAKSHITRKWMRYELEAMRGSLKEELAELEKKFTRG